MNRRWIQVSFGFCIFLFSGLIGFGESAFNFKLPESSEPIYGTWINPDNGGSYWRDAQKWVFSNWGKGLLYEKILDDQPAKEFTFILVEKWKDSDSNTWYKAYQQFAQGHFYLLAKIGNDSNSLEMMLAGGFLNEKDLIPKSAKGTYYVFRRE